MLTTDFLGHTLKTPLMLTEGPLSGNEELIRTAAESDVGLIFTKGIRPEPVASPVPFMNVYKGTLMNADWSCIGIDEWERILPRLDISVPLVTSIAKNYVSPETAVEMAQRLVKAGSKIISFVDYDPVQLVETVKNARSKIGVPIMVKLAPFLPDLEKRLEELVDAGIDAIAAMDSIGPGMVIDHETGVPSLGSGDGGGYVSGKFMLPFTLEYIYEIARFVDIPVVGVGGVTDTPSAVQMVMAGATGVGMVTAPMLRGFGKFRDINEGLESYLGKRSLSHIDEIRGKTLRINSSRTISNEYKALIDNDLCTSCGLCVKVCYSNAVKVEEKTYVVDNAECVGCGLCSGVCPAGAITYR